MCHLGSVEGTMFPHVWKISQPLKGEGGEKESLKISGHCVLTKKETMLFPISQNVADEFY